MHPYFTEKCSKDIKARKLVTTDKGHHHTLPSQSVKLYASDTEWSNLQLKAGELSVSSPFMFQFLILQNKKFKQTSILDSKKENTQRATSSEDVSEL